MNALIQCESTLIGSKEAIVALEKRKNASLLVISDTHGGYEVLKQIVENFGAECDALVFCGDGFSDVGMLLEEAFHDEKLRSCLPPVIACARGNGDSEICSVYVPNEEVEKTDLGELRNFRVTQTIHFSAAGRRILSMHGHRHGIELGVASLLSFAYQSDADMVFYGHTHQHAREEIDGTLFLNPGSCTRPRGGQTASFAVVSFPGETERFQADFFSVHKALFGNYTYSQLAL